MQKRMAGSSAAGSRTAGAIRTVPGRPADQAEDGPPGEGLAEIRLPPPRVEPDVPERVGREERELGRHARPGRGVELGGVERDAGVGGERPGHGG